MEEGKRREYLALWRESGERKMLARCELCPRKCGARRLDGRAGYCGADEGEYVRVARAAPHDWEEPSISGDVLWQDGKRIGGSGTVFFSHCTLGCVFCQNRAISRPDSCLGRRMDAVALAEVFLRLQEQGVYNINLVTPTQYLPQIIFALRVAKWEGLRIPVVYNTGGYERWEMLRLLSGLIDIYLPDCKYLDREAAGRYSGAGDYPEVVFAALDEMVRQAGSPQFDEKGLLRRGVVVRHLLLPGHVSDGKRIVKLLYERYGENILISLMNQYTPPSDEGFEEAYPELAAPISPDAYRRAADFAIRMGVNGYIQEGGTVSESFIPDFE